MPRKTIYTTLTILLALAASLSSAAAATVTSLQHTATATFRIDPYPAPEEVRTDSQTSTDNFEALSTQVSHSLLRPDVPELFYPPFSASASARASSLVRAQLDSGHLLLTASAQGEGYSFDFTPVPEPRVWATPFANGSVAYSDLLGQDVGIVWNAAGAWGIDSENSAQLDINVGSNTTRHTFSEMQDPRQGFTLLNADTPNFDLTANIRISDATDDPHFIRFNWSVSMDVWYAFGGLPGQASTPIRLEPITPGDTNPVDDSVSFPVGVASLGTTDFLHTTVAVDPNIPVELEYATRGLRSISIPDALPGGDDDFTLRFLNGLIVPVQAGQVVDISQLGLGANGANSFWLSGLDFGGSPHALLGDNLVDVDVAFKFRDPVPSDFPLPGYFRVTAMPVPEPSTFGLLVAAALMGKLWRTKASPWQFIGSHDRQPST